MVERQHTVVGAVAAEDQRLRERDVEAVRHKAARALWALVADGRTHSVRVTESVVPRTDLDRARGVELLRVEVLLD